VLDWPLNVVVVRSGGRTILVDAGLGVEFPDFPRAGQTVHRLEVAGINPDAITDVVLTHLHMDHVGGLLSEGLKERLRPDLRVHVASAEAEFWEAPAFSHTDMPAPVPDGLRSIASRFLDEYRGQLRTFETEYELAPGVLVARTGGHNPWAQHRPSGVRQRMPDVCPATPCLPPVSITPSGTKALNTTPRNQPASGSNSCASWRRKRVAGVATHLPFPSVCHVAAAGGVFRCVPAGWDY